MFAEPPRDIDKHCDGNFLRRFVHSANLPANETHGEPSPNDLLKVKKIQRFSGPPLNCRGAWLSNNKKLIYGIWKKIYTLYYTILHINLWSASNNQASKQALHRSKNHAIPSWCVEIRQTFFWWGALVVPWMETQTGVPNSPQAGLAGGAKLKNAGLSMKSKNGVPKPSLFHIFSHCKIEPFCPWA